MADKSWHLYLIECVNGSIYTGITTDVAARFVRHASGRGARYTRAFPPLRLLGSFPYPDRSAASRAEHAVRKLPAAAKRALCRGTGPPVPEVRATTGTCAAGRLGQ